MLERASAVMKSHYEGGRRGLILLNTYYVGTMWEYRVYASLCQFSQKLYRRSMLCIKIIIIFCLPTRKLRQMGLKLIGITQPDRTIKIKLSRKTINISEFSSNDSDTKLLGSDWRKFL